MGRFRNRKRSSLVANVQQRNVRILFSFNGDYLTFAKKLLLIDYENFQKIDLSLLDESTARLSRRKTISTEGRL